MWLYVFLADDCILRSFRNRRSLTDLTSCRLFPFQFLEDLTVTYDGTVRDSRGDIVQFRYGSDGLDPCEMEVEGFPADLNRELANIKVSITSHGSPKFRASSCAL